MSPFGHLSVSYLACSISKKISIPAILIGGLLPDIDFLFILFPFFNSIHRVVTHNLLFILFSALVISYGFAKDRRLQFFTSLLIGGILHLLVDSCMDINATNGIGVPFFWLFDPTFYSPVNFRTPLEFPAGWNDIGGMMRVAFFEMVYEIPMIILAIAVLIIKRGLIFKKT